MIRGSPKTCFEASCSAIYAQMGKKQNTFLREAPPQVQGRLEDQIVLERMLQFKDPEAYPDASTNAVALEHLQHYLPNGVGQALHVVMLDPVCDPSTLSDIIAYLEHRAGKEEDTLGLPVTKFVGAARVPEGVSLDEVRNTMVGGHDEHLTPVYVSDDATPID